MTIKTNGMNVYLISVERSLLYKSSYLLSPVIAIHAEKAILVYYFCVLSSFRSYILSNLIPQLAKHLGKCPVYNPVFPVDQPTDIRRRCSHFLASCACVTPSSKHLTINKADFISEVQCKFFDQREIAPSKRIH